MRNTIKKLCVSVLLFLVCILAVPQTLQAAAAKPNARIRSYYVGADSAGYVIGTGESLKLQARTYIGASDFKGKIRLRIRVLNNKGKYVYQKNWTIKKSGTGTVNWNGKPSAGNDAKLSAASYVDPGDYKVQFAIRYKASGTKKWKTLKKKTVSLKIVEEVKETEPETEPETQPETEPEKKPESDSSQNTTVKPSSTYTFEGAVFTGNKKIDYIAEKMIKAAGVKKGMSEDERVKKIYHFMTVNFNHVHYKKSQSYKIYYKIETKKQKKKVEAYYAETQQKYEAGKITYGKVSSSILWNMKRRIGECNHHALVFKILCRHVGVDSGICKGYYINMNGTRAGHYWNYAVVSGKRYYYDVDVEIQNYGRGQGDYYWYKDDRAKAEKRHQFVTEE